MGSSTGLLDVGGQRLVTPPIRGRADELKVIGALVAAVAQGRGRVLVTTSPTRAWVVKVLGDLVADDENDERLARDTASTPGLWW
jgi:hypothetical protein